MRKDRFIQPIGAVTIVSRAKGPRTPPTQQTIAEGRRRVAAGEDPEKVAAELAIEEVAMLTKELRGDEP